MTEQFRVSIDLSELLAANAATVEAALPLVSQAVRGVAQLGAAKWKDAVWKAPLWSVEKQAYIDSIQWQMTGPFTAEIWSDYDKADEIERGRPSRDLKRALNTSFKVRVAGTGSKHPGQRYLIIPFRHNTPNGEGQGAHAPQMPASVYAEASKLEQSSITGRYWRESGTGAYDVKSKAAVKVRARHYSWQGALPAGLAPKLKDSHVTDPYAGMVRMDTHSSRSGKSSAYLTFRVMGEWSSGWVVGPRPGLNIVSGVTDALQPDLDEFIGKAITLGMLKKQS